MRKVLIMAAFAIGISGCYNDKYDKLYPDPATTVTCDTTTITYAHDIVPILTANCNIAGGCHDATGAAVSGYNFTTHAGIQPVATTAILIGDINQSPSSSRYTSMPKNLPKISDCDIQKITRWVNQGAPNN